MYHTPVLLDESINGLKLTKGGIYVDATFGGGGHSKEILKRLKGGKLFSFDKDPDAADNAINDKRFMLINADYRYIKNYLRLHDAIPCDGILADLGISSHQIDTPGRGFSTRFEGRLDMRMDSRSEVSAADIVNDYQEDELAAIFWKYGEIRNNKVLAAKIAGVRNNRKITTTGGTRKASAVCR